MRLQISPLPATLRTADHNRANGTLDLERRMYSGHTVLFLVQVKDKIFFPKVVARLSLFGTLGYTIWWLPILATRPRRPSLYTHL
jgi:hypothetical protein